MTDELFAPTEPSIDEQIREIEREIGKRAEVFPRWVAAGNKTQKAADYQMACMRAALATLRREQQRLKPSR